MAVAYKPETHWDKSAYAQLRATWSPRRIEKDRKTIRKIFKLAVKSPLLMESLAWAYAHDITIMVDRKGKGMGGYYQTGTGVLAVLPRFSADAADTIVHEIRHAWQDYHGLLVSGSGQSELFSSFFIKRALVEADARAYGLAAGAEVKAAKLSRRIWRALFARRKPQPDRNEILRKEFLQWFRIPFTTRYYGNFLSRFYGARTGAYQGKQANHRTELNSPAPPTTGLDIENIQDVLRLGNSLSGGSNYLAGLQPDVLPKEILRPSLANSFWGAARRKQKKLTADIRKTQLRQMLAAPKPRHPWP